MALSPVDTVADPRARHTRALRPVLSAERFGWSKGPVSPPPPSPGSWAERDDDSKGGDGNTGSLDRSATAGTYARDVELMGATIELTCGDAVALDRSWRRTMESLAGSFSEVKRVQAGAPVGGVKNDDEDDAASESNGPKTPAKNRSIAEERIAEEPRVEEEHAEAAAIDAVADATVADVANSVTAESLVTAESSLETAGEIRRQLERMLQAERAAIEAERAAWSMERSQLLKERDELRVVVNDPAFTVAPSMSDGKLVDAAMSWDGDAENLAVEALVALTTALRGEDAGFDRRAQEQRATAVAKAGGVAAVLGVRTRDVPAAIRDRSKPYLPSRFVELLGKTRVVEFRSLRKGKAKRGRPRKDAKTKEHTKTPTLTGAVVDAVRAYLCRVAHGDWSRWGCIAGDVLVELRMRTNEGGEMSGNERDNVCVVDSPGAPLTKSTWTNHHSRAHLVRALASTPLDALLCVCDGGFGPSRELRGCLRESGCLDRMVSSPDGGAMALAWPLDKLVATDPSISLDPDVYVAMQTKLAERGQGSELDGSEEDDSEDSGFDSPGFDEGTMGARSIERRLSGRASTPDESWTLCLARAAGRNGGIVKGAMASQPVHTFFGAVRDSGPKTKFRYVYFNYRTCN